MTPEADLNTLLRGMTPTLTPGIYGFCTMAKVPPGLHPRVMVQEAEGTTLVLPWAEAKALNPSFRCRMITLNVHSALDAVGFLAAVATRLATAGIPSNAVAGYHHDHLCVPEARAPEALALLQAMTTAPLP